MIAVTIAVGRYYQDLAREAAASVEWSTGLRTSVITETNGEKRPSNFKLRLLDWWPDETVLFFDADTRFLRPWNVSMFDGLQAFAASLDMPSSALDADCARYQIKPERYFNAGVWFANRRFHKQAFDFADTLVHSPQYVTRFQYEQTALNVAIQRFQIPLLELPRRYNALCDPKTPIPDDAVVVHRAGGRSDGPHEKIFRKAIQDAGSLQAQSLPR